MKWLLVLALMLACSPSCAPKAVRVPIPPQVPEPQLLTPVCAQCMVYDAPTLYTEWWTNIEKCTGLTGRLDKIKWELAPKPIIRFPDAQGLYLALYFPGENVVVVGLFRELDSTIIGHEMAHALMDQNGTYDYHDKHPLKVKQECGNAVGFWQ